MTLFLAINHVETVVRCQRRLGLKSGRFNRKRNSSMTNVECRIKEFFLFYLLKKEPSEATSTIRSAEGGSIFNRQFRLVRIRGLVCLPITSGKSITI